VVGKGFDAFLAEPVGGLFGGFAGVAVDDAGLERAGLHELEDLTEDGLFLLDPVGEVGSVEGGDVVGGGSEFELFDDVAPDTVGRGGGEGHKWRIRKTATELGELAVLGAEVVSPLGNAVCLIHGEAADFPLLEVFEKAAEHEAFRGDVEHLVVAGEELGVALGCVFFGEGGIEESGGDTVFGETIDLILHEGDERGDDYGEALGEDCGELVAEGLAAAGREKGKDVPFIEGIVYDIFLERAELIVSEVFFEGCVDAVRHEEGEL